MTIERAGELALAEAQRQFRVDIHDPPIGDPSSRAAHSLAAINAIFRAAGYTGVYRGNGPPQWCGLFGAACWRAAGIDPTNLAHFWLSTFRLKCWGHYLPCLGVSSGSRPVVGGRLMIDVHRDTKPDNVRFPDGTPPRAGDVVIVGNGKLADGNHVTIGESWNPSTGTMHTIAGNGVGPGPDGQHREGVVESDFHVNVGSYTILHVLRPGIADIVLEREL